MEQLKKLIEKGKDAFEANDYEKAINYFEKALKIDRNNIDALQYLGVCLTMAGNPGTGLLLLNRALEQNPDKDKKIEIYAALANAFSFKGQEKGDTRFYDKSIEINTIVLKELKDEGTYLNLGNVYKYKQDYKNSIKIFNEGLTKYPKSARLMVHLGNTFSAQSDDNGNFPTEAVEMYNQAKKIDPNYIGSYLNLGIAYMNVGEDKLAEKEFRQVLKLDPYNEQAIFFLEDIKKQNRIMKLA
ncbi:MAG: tetratricopeptide repeat protein [archaeon]